MVSLILHTGLPTFANINITVAAETDVGTGPQSLPVPVTTFGGCMLKTCLSIILFEYMYFCLCPVPGAPTTVKSTILDETSIELTWSPPSNPNGILEGYQIVYYGYSEKVTTKVSFFLS